MWALMHIYSSMLKKKLKTKPQNNYCTNISCFKCKCSCRNMTTYMQPFTSLCILYTKVIYYSFFSRKRNLHGYVLFFLIFFFIMKQLNNFFFFFSYCEDYSLHVNSGCHRVLLGGQFWNPNSTEARQEITERKRIWRCTFSRTVFSP